MDLLISNTVAHAQLSAYETAIGTSPVLKIFGDTTIPASTSASITGTEVASITLPSDWLDTPSGREAAFLGTLQAGAAAATVTAMTYFVIYASNGTTPHVIGDITVTGGGGKLTVASLAVTIGQPINITGMKLSRS